VYSKYLYAQDVPVFNGRRFCYLEDMGTLARFLALLFAFRSLDSIIGYVKFDDYVTVLTVILGILKA
jgi:hypothetical protein